MATIARPAPISSGPEATGTVCAMAGSWKSAVLGAMWFAVKTASATRLVRIPRRGPAAAVTSLPWPSRPSSRLPCRVPRDFHRGRSSGETDRKHAVLHVIGAEHPGHIECQHGQGKPQDEHAGACRASHHIATADRFIVKGRIPRESFSSGGLRDVHRSDLAHEPDSSRRVHYPGAARELQGVQSARCLATAGGVERVRRSWPERGD